MSELTPERIRDAAAVVEFLYGNTDILVTGKKLLATADKLEREQAAEAKREKRIEELAEEVFAIRNPGASWAAWADHRAWRDVASALIDRYPALAEAVDR